VRAAEASPLPRRGRGLENAFTGPGKCLDIINDGTNNQRIMAHCGNFSGQAWKTRAFR
jgi:hypothetical protein